MSFTPNAVLSMIHQAMVKVDPNLGDLVIAPDTRFGVLGISSIVMITIVFEVEEQFDISIVDAGLDSFDTVGEMQDLVLRLLAQKVAA